MDYGRLLATLIRVGGDIELAEEALQDAFGEALEAWVHGVPANPAGWLATTARRRLIDRLRRRSMATERLERIWEASSASPTAQDDRKADDFPHGDDRLRLVFTCCHPALAHDVQVALTLNTLLGLSTAEIARAFLLKERTLAQRLVRAKRKIRRAAIPYRIPPRPLLDARLPAVLHVVYLVFNEGYAATRGEALQRVDLAADGLRLAGLLCELMPREPEVWGLRSLLTLQHARRDARVAADGALVPLEEQDRSLWHREAITAGLAMLGAACPNGRAGPYGLQAAIAAEHARAESAEATDWGAIAELYRELVSIVPTPVVELNRAVAVGMAEGPDAGLRLLAPLESALSGYVYYHATRGDLLRRMGELESANDAFDAAHALAENEAERAHLRRRRTKDS